MRCWKRRGTRVLDGGEGAKEMALAQEFVKACMRVNPKDRLTAQQALKHPWFAPRADDSQSVAIGASKAAIAALERRVASLTATDAPKRVMRWFGRLAGRKLSNRDFIADSNRATIPIGTLLPD